MIHWLIIRIIGLRQLTGKTFRLHHLFSAEIDAFKQSYIQRNFSPEIIFRDVNELVAEEAYVLTLLQIRLNGC